MSWIVYFGLDFSKRMAPPIRFNILVFKYYKLKIAPEIYNYMEYTSAITWLVIQVCLIHMFQN